MTAEPVPFHSDSPREYAIHSGDQFILDMLKDVEAEVAVPDPDSYQPFIQFPPIPKTAEALTARLAQLVRMRDYITRQIQWLNMQPESLGGIEYHCLRCDYRWLASPIRKPKHCGRCHAYNWDVPPKAQKTYRERGRPPETYPVGSRQWKRQETYRKRKHAQQAAREREHQDSSAEFERKESEAEAALYERAFGTLPPPPPLTIPSSVAPAPGAVLSLAERMRIQSGAAPAIPSPSISVGPDAADPGSASSADPAGIIAHTLPVPRDPDPGPPLPSPEDADVIASSDIT